MKTDLTKLAKLMLFYIAGICLASGVVAQEVPPSVQATMHATVDGGPVLISGYLLSFEGGKIIFSDNDDGFNRRDVELAAIDRMYVELPDDIKEALDTYRSGEYADAVTKLRTVAARYSSLRGLEPVGIKEMEVYYLDAMRRSGRYDEVRQAYDRVRVAEYLPYQQALIRSIPAWHAWSRQNWEGVNNMLSDINLDEVPVEISAQFAFLRAEAHRGFEEHEAALTEYHRAAILDRTRDLDMLERILKAALDIYVQDESLSDFFASIRGNNYNPNAGYNIRVREGAWIVEFAEKVRPNNMTLDPRYNRLKEAVDILKSDVVKNMASLGGDPTQKEREAVGALLNDVPEESGEAAGE